MDRIAVSPFQTKTPVTDDLWPITANTAIVLVGMVAFWLGVLLTMLAYGSGWMEAAK